jgi:hypothetical protein
MVTVERLSQNVVMTCVFFVGKVGFLGISVVIVPPSVSMPVAGASS